MNKDIIFYRQIIQSQAKQIDTLIEVLDGYKVRCSKLEDGIDELLDEIHTLKCSKNGKSSEVKDLADNLTYILKFLSDND